MTHTTDKERDEFEAWWREYGLGDYDTQFEAWQASRRAQVVPKSLNVTEEMHVAAVKVLHRATGVDGLPQRIVDAMLAAAPKLPEVAQLDDTNVADMAQAVDSKEEAPVQLPDCRGRVLIDEDGEDFIIWRGGMPPENRTNIYTEHQVRQLLAQHGIK